MGETRLAELIAALSLATDLGMGRSMEFALRVAMLAVELGRQVGLGTPELADSYYLALVKHIGCTSDALEFSRYAGGDDIAFRHRAMLWPGSPKAQVMRELVLHTAEDRDPLTRGRLVAEMIAGGERRPRQAASAHCEAGGRLAERLGLSEGVRLGLEHEQERWDGRGLPSGLSGEELAPAHRVVMVAHDALGMNDDGPGTVEAITSRAGTAYDPAVVAVFKDVWEAPQPPGGADLLARAIAAEPGIPVTVADADVDQVAMAIADFTDLKSPYLLGHSTRVAELAQGAAATLGLSNAECTVVRRAALLHDVGRTGIPNGIWDKPGSLSAAEIERVRLHTYYTERVLAASPATASLAVVAGSHHENLDGTGYHRGTGSGGLGEAARILRAADCFDAMTSSRPHRPALTREEAIRELKAEVDEGRLDARAVTAVLEASGVGRVLLRPPRPGGLSEREIDVLRLMIRGLSNKEIGATLYVSPKTVGHHVQHIYNKIGVTSRAAAALFAMEVGLT